MDLVKTDTLITYSTKAKEASIITKDESAWANKIETLASISTLNKKQKGYPQGAANIDVWP